MGVQVPPLAPRSPSRASLLALALALAGLAACTPDPLEFAAVLESGLRAPGKGPDEAFLDACTPASRDLALGLYRLESEGHGAPWTALRDRLRADLKGAKPVRDESAGPNVLLRREGGGGVLLVRDGHGWRLDLVLSQAPHARLQGGEPYPAPDLK